jgi:hypothetical protein
MLHHIRRIQTEVRGIQHRPDHKTSWTARMAEIE